MTTWHRFHIRLEPDALDGGWIAECLDLPGCMGQGETQDEAMQNLIDAMSDVRTTKRPAPIP